jgi:hypothetical protein
MRIAEVSMWTPRLIVEVLSCAAVVLLILFGITLIIVGGYYFVRFAIPSLFGKSFTALQKRSAAAMQSGHLALLALVCGPLVSTFVGLVTLLALLREPGFEFLAATKLFLLMTGLGTLAGIIAGGAFWASSKLLGRARKTVKKWTRGGVWDADFDVIA